LKFIKNPERIKMNFIGNLKTWAATALMTGMLVGCGGGGGSPSLPSANPPASTTTSPLAKASLTVGIYNTSGTRVTNIGLGGGFVAQATVLDATGVAVAGKLVTFALPDAALATLSPTSALTSAAGVAQVTVVPSSISSVGATTVTASALLGTDTVVTKGSSDFAVAAPSVALSAISASSSSLVSGGNTLLNVTVLVSGAPLTAQPANVAFTTSCGRINTIDTSTTVATNGSGVATVTYSAVAGDGSLCSGAINITASTPGAVSSARSLTAAAPTAAAVTFMNATPAQIFVAGMGAVEQSLVSFKVLSSANTALQGASVDFSLQANPGSVTLSTLSGTTDSTGVVTVTVSAGPLPGPVKVRAALTSNTAVFAESQNLTVASGPPSQKFMSLSVSVFNIEGATADGTPTTLTVRIADRQGNAVVDGTVVNFTAEGGQVGRTCATTTTNLISSCSVTFISQNPRPANGRVSVLAYLEGTKDYIDLNNNNRYDAGIDTLVQIGDAYRDDNENLTYDSATDGFVFPRGVAGTCPTQTSGAFPSRAGTCDLVSATQLATTVRQQAVILFSSSSPKLYIQSQTTSSFTFLMGSGDPGLSLLPMPAGTKVVVSAIDTTSANSLTCSVSDFAGSDVPNIAPTPGMPNQDLRTVHAASLKDCASGDNVKVTVTSPGGLVTEFPYTLP